VSENREGLTVDADSMTQQMEPTADQADRGADLLVAVLGEFDSNDIATMCDALRTFPGNLRIAVSYPGRDEGAGSSHAESAEAAEAAQGPSSVFFVPSLLTKPSVIATGLQSMSETYQSVFAAAEKLQARGCCIMASKLEAMTPSLPLRMAQPLFEGQADLVLPHYTRRKFDGLLNASVIAPMTRALYGKRVNSPMGPDVAVSQRLFQRLLSAQNGGAAGGNRLHPLASLTPTALCHSLAITEVHVGARSYPSTDWGNMSSVLADVLTPIFIEMDRNAACWQRTRFSTPVPAIGEPAPLGQDTGTVETRQMIESFALANRELQEIWSLVLPPSSLFELRKVSRLPPEQFRLPDELWVKVVYDFALAHHLRTISRDHLLRSMTPLYLGWVASYAKDLLSPGATSPERRLERLSLAYEAGKSHLISRWRWPDRFNP
jgi:glucosylglycerate synthase